MNSPDSGTAPKPLHLTALFGLSAAVLAFEVLLLRLFEFSHWHHFAGLAVSLALLGLGAAGTVLALLGERALRWGDRLFLLGLTAMAAGLLLVIALHARVALRPAFSAWDMGELGLLLLVDLTAFLPFFGAGLAIGQTFARWPRHSGRIYAANLFGSGVGSISASVLLVWLPTATALALIALALPLFGAAVAWAQWQRGSLAGCAAVTALAIPALIWTPAPAVSDFKALARLKDLPGAETLDTRPGLAGELTLIRAPSLRVAPGLSLSWTKAVPGVDGAVIGSDRVIPVAPHYPPTSDHGDASLAGLASQLRPEGRVLVLGTGTWQTPAVLGDRPLTWVDPDARLLRLFRERGLDGPEQHLVKDGLYRHLTVGSQRYSVIALDTAYDGGDAASEDYLLTVEGLQRALSRLETDGLLAIPLRVHYPPRDFPRALRTIAEALERHGAMDPGRNIAALRGLQSALVLVRPTPLSNADVAAVKQFAERWRFDRVWLPGMSASVANRYHQLETPVFHQSARAVFTGGALPEEARWFTTAPAKLEQPYFWRSLRWERAPRLVDTLGQRGMSYLDWTLLMGVATTLAAVLLSAVLILAPLGRLPRVRPPLSRITLLGYFAALGLGYMLLEMAVFQRAILFLGAPVLAASMVFALFLIGSGIGSALGPADPRPATVVRIYAPLAATLALAVFAGWGITDLLLEPALPGRAILLGLLLLPLTWALGRPFPWGLRRLTEQRHWVPWAWGINGFASVVAASLAPLVSVHFGQTTTLAAGALCYLIAAAIAWRWASASSP